MWPDLETQGKWKRTVRIKHTMMIRHKEGSTGGYTTHNDNYKDEEMGDGGIRQATHCREKIALF